METATKLRPLTDLEQKAPDDVRAGGTVEKVATRLGRSQAWVLAAMDLAKGWEAVYVQMAAPGRRAMRVVASTAVEAEVEPVAAPVVAEIPVLDPEPAVDSAPAEVAVEPERGPTADGDAESEAGPEEAVAEPGTSSDGAEPGQFEDLPALLDRGLASTNLRVLDLARALVRYSRELRGLLAVDEQTAAIQEQIDAMEAALAAKRAELAALTGGRPAPVRAFPLPARVAAEPRIPTHLYHSAEVRAWGKANGFNVADRGVIKKEAVVAYIAAHSAAAAI